MLPAIFYTERKEYHLLSYDDKESRHVWAYEDEDGWHGRLMSEPDPALLITWAKGHWRSV
jgi:hypothetical protein